MKKRIETVWYRSKRQAIKHLVSSVVYLMTCNQRDIIGKISSPDDFAEALESLAEKLDLCYEVVGWWDVSDGSHSPCTDPEGNHWDDGMVACEDYEDAEREAHVIVDYCGNDVLIKFI